MAKKTISEIHEEMRKIAMADITEKDVEIVSSIQMYIRELNGDGITGKNYKDFSADELSRISGALSNLCFSLNEVQSKRKTSLELQKRDLKTKKAHAMDMVIEQLKQRKNGKYPTVSEIALEVDKLYGRDEYLIIFKEENYNMIMGLFWSAKDKIQDLRTRIQVLLSEKASTKFMDDSLELEFPVPNINNLKQDVNYNGEQTQELHQ